MEIPVQLVVSNILLLLCSKISKTRYHLKICIRCDNSVALKTRRYPQTSRVKGPFLPAFDRVGDAVLVGPHWRPSLGLRLPRERKVLCGGM